MLGCLEDGHSITSLEVIIGLVLSLSLLSYSVSYFPIEPLLYFISYFDDFAVFEDTLW